MPWKKRIQNKADGRSFSKFDLFFEQNGIAIFLCLGILFRIYWIFCSPCEYNADSSIIYLMGKHILHTGDFPLFNYGQAYMSAFTSYALAFFFLIFGIGELAIKMCAITFSVIFYVLLILMINSVINRKTALWAAFYSVVFPINFYFIPLEYNLFMIAGILFLWILAHYLIKKDRFSAVRVAVLGIIAGTGWYFHPLFCYFLVLFFVVMAIRILFITTRRLRVFEEFLIGCACFLIGSIPYWYGLYTLHGLHDPFNAFQIKKITYAAEMAQTLARTLPSFLVANTGTQLTQFIALLVYMSVITISLFSLKSTIRKWKHGYFRARLLFQFLFVIVLILFSSHTSAKDAAAFRYLAPLIIVWPVLIADVLEKIPLQMQYVKYILAGLFLLHNTYSVYTYNPQPNNLPTLISSIQKNGIEQGFTDYENAYKMVFLSNEILTVSPFWGVDRYISYTHNIMKSPNKFYLFDRNNHTQNERYEKFLTALDIAGITYQEEQFDTFVMIHTLIYESEGMRIPVRYFSPIFIHPNEKSPHQQPEDDSQIFEFPLALPAGEYSIITSVTGSYSPDINLDYPTAEFALIDIQSDALIGKSRCTNGDFQVNPVKSLRFKILHKSSSPVLFHYSMENESFVPKYLIIL
ncbi:glycosyltransferase family 39 protein [bacterium]|nr:glycosyltransferase family 39 protein [bacterium]MCP5463243.1 glycosyltransferase family 39 protein [bacterium]